MTPIRLGSAGWISLGIALVIGLAACAPRSGPTVAARPGEVSPALLRQLRTGTVKEREAAAQALAGCPDPAATVALRAGLADPEARVRAAAAAALGHQKADLAAPDLLAALADRDAAVAEAARLALARLGPGAVVVPAVARLDHRDPAVRRRLLAVLAAHGPAAAAELAPRVVGVAKAPAALVEAFVALGEPALDLAVLALFKVLRKARPEQDGPEDEAEHPPEHALVLRFGGPAAAATVKHFVAFIALIPDTAFSGDEAPPGMLEVLQGVADLLAQLGEPGARAAAGLLRRAALADHVRERRREARERRAAAEGGSSEDGEDKAEENRTFAWNHLATEALGRMKPPPFAAVAPLVRHRVAKVREAGLEALEDIVHPESVKLARLAIRDRDDDVRGAAVKVLARQGDASVVPDLIGLLKDDSYLVIWRVVTELVKRRAIEARVPLCEVLQRPGGYRTLPRKAALEGLTALGSISCGADVLKLLGDSSAYLRAAAAKAAGTLGTPEAVSGVLPLLRDPDQTVRVAAVEAAGALLGRRADRKLDTAVRAALADAQLLVRLAAVNVAGSRADRAALPVLIRMTGDPLAPVRAAALGAVGQIGDRSALRAVEKALGDAVVTNRRDAHLAYYLITGALHATAQAAVKAAPACGRLAALLACVTGRLPAARRPAEREPLLPLLRKVLDASLAPAAPWRAIELECTKAAEGVVTRAGAVPATRRCLPR